MTLEQANQRYQELLAAYNARRISQAQFQAGVGELKLQGRWRCLAAIVV